MSATADIGMPHERADEESSGWFVYGVTWADVHIPGDLTGLAGEPVVAIPCGGVAAIVTRVDTTDRLGRGADLLAYNSVLDALAARSGPVAPVRFGSVLPDVEAARQEFLAPDEQFFTQILDSLTGREQFMFAAEYVEERILGEIVQEEPAVAALRARTRGLPPEAGYADRVHLGELVAAAVERRREHDADRLLDEVLPLAVAHVVRPVAGLEPVVDVALLVDTDHREALENRLEVLAEEEHGRIRLRLMGPVAAYDFAGGA